MLGHIRALNEERESFLIAERLADRYDTVYEFEFEMALTSYSDVYKEQRGIRPQLDRDWTLEEVRAKIDRLYERSQESF